MRYLVKDFLCEQSKNHWIDFKPYVKSLNEGIKTNRRTVAETSTEKDPQTSDLTMTKENPVRKTYDSLEDVHNLVRSYTSSMPSDSIRRYYEQMGELGIEKTENNIKSIFILKKAS